MEHDLRKAIRLDQLFEQRCNPGIFNGCSKRTGHDQIVVVVFPANGLFCEILRKLPLHQHFRNGLRQKHLAGTGGCFRLFQNQDGLVCFTGIREHTKHILLVQNRKCRFAHPLQLLIDIDKRLTGSDALRRDVHAVPGETKDLPHTHRAGKRQINCQLQPFILTYFQGMEQCFCIPDFSFVNLRLGNRCIDCRILFHQLPLYRLMEGASQYVVNPFDRTGSDILRFLFCILPVGHLSDRRSLKQLHVILLQHAGGNVRQLHGTDQRKYVVVHQSVGAGIHGERPGTFSVDCNVFTHQVLDSFAIGNHHIPHLLAVLNLRLPPLCICQRFEALPFLLSFAILCIIQINHIVAVPSLYN